VGGGVGLREPEEERLKYTLGGSCRSIVQYSNYFGVGWSIASSSIYTRKHFKTGALRRIRLKR
jgi:hypothetical protein